MSWDQVQERVSGFDAVLIDTPGFHLDEQSEVEYLNDILQMPRDCRKHLVLSTQSNQSALRAKAETYTKVPFDDVIFTGLDQTHEPGLIYSLSKDLGRPLHGFGIGDHIPDDFEYASRERVVDLIFEISKFRGSNKESQY